MQGGASSHSHCHFSWSGTNIHHGRVLMALEPHVSVYSYAVYIIAVTDVFRNQVAGRIDCVQDGV